MAKLRDIQTTDGFPFLSSCSIISTDAPVISSLSGLYFLAVLIKASGYIAWKIPGSFL